MGDVAIRVDNVSKAFKLPHEKQTSVKSLFVSMFRGKRTYERQRVLKNVSFEIKKGEFFGIVGRNGSGKSTLLKLMAGIYAADKGDVQTNGTLAPFIELGVGFNPELTGRENVFLNGALLGFNRKEMAAKYDTIVEFAELERFMDQKLKNYSSGMQVRLAFSIAIQADSDILLLDEVLAVGDEAFQQKCLDVFEDYKARKQTVILVTHDMEAVNRFCSRAMLLEDGIIKSIGTPKKVANQYSLDNLSVKKTKNKELSDAVKRLEVKALSPNTLSNDKEFEFEIRYELRKNIDVDLGISLIHQGQSIIEHNTRDLRLGNKKNKLYKIRYKLPLKAFTPRHMSIDVAIFEKKDFRLIGFNSGSCDFIITAKGGVNGGILNTRGEWVVTKETA